MKRRCIIAVLLMCMQLTACGAAGENGAETGTSEASSASETVETTETTVEGSSEAETTEAQTEITTETAPDIDIEKVELLSLNDVEAVSGCPEICDTESIKARHKDDVEQFYSSDYGDNNKEYSQLAELEMVSPTMRPLSISISPMILTMTARPNTILLSKTSRTYPMISATAVLMI